MYGSSPLLYRHNDRLVLISCDTAALPLIILYLNRLTNNSKTLVINTSLSLCLARSSRSSPVSASTGVTLDLVRCSKRYTSFWNVINSRFFFHLDDCWQLMLCGTCTRLVCPSSILEDIWRSLKGCKLYVWLMWLICSKVFLVPSWGFFFLKLLSDPVCRQAQLQWRHTKQGICLVSAHTSMSLRSTVPVKAVTGKCHIQNDPLK